MVVVDCINTIAQFIVSLIPAIIMTITPSSRRTHYALLNKSYQGILAGLTNTESKSVAKPAIKTAKKASKAAPKTAKKTAKKAVKKAGKK